MLANKNWYNDSRYPVGSLMGLSNVVLTAQNCARLTELKGQRVNVVYVPPINAIATGSVFRVPTSSPGVAIDIGFPDGTPHPGGILLGTSQGDVSSGGLMTAGGSRIPPVRVTLSLVKTGAFTDDKTKSSIQVTGGLGAFRYYSSSDATLVSASQDQLQMPTKYGPVANDYLGSAMAPTCEIAALGDVSLVTGLKVISLGAVNASDFSGIGAVEKSAKAQHFSFTCKGTSDTKPVVNFDATYPFNAGVEGVGMPEASSDIGIQVLLNDNPVAFRKNSPVLGWNLTQLSGGVVDVRYGLLGPQGRYCTTGCGQDMSGANWVNGEAGEGNNDQMTDATVTFKYYQTTSSIPQARKFSVPFTVTLDVP
jgi:hypothetical protein